MDQWKPVNGYEGLYEISQDGNIRSIERIVVTRSGVKRKLKGKLIKSRTNNCSYVEVRLSKNGIDTTCFIHRLLVEAFIGRIEEGFEVNHKDGNPQNNRLDNLEIVTHSQNIKHAYDNGLIKRKTKQVIDRCTGKMFDSSTEAAICLNLRHNTLRNYLNGHSHNPTCLKYI
ncbi:MAG TPA: NUMOD4 motif-containing HNH endonuclease [Chitinophagaceae bacterium]|nr:NUMOD4 motif-containing HNH endonuclease [Chitinophagaceae bacterium]